MKQNTPSDARLRSVHIGLTDVSPLTVTPAFTNFAECFYFDGPVGNGGTESFNCHDGGIMGRFLIVQVEHNEPLTICETQVYESEYVLYNTGVINEYRNFSNIIHSRL